MAEVELNWSTAEVEDGKLVVALAGEVSSQWKESFEMTDRLLTGGGWGKVQVKKQRVRVSDVSAGSEEKLRHHLESVVAQANAAVRPPEPEAEKRAEEEGEGDSADARMTEAFRAFAKNSEAERSAR